VVRVTSANQQAREDKWQQMMKKSQMIDGIWLVKVKFDDGKENIIFRFSTLDFHIDVKNNNPADGLSSGEH
jgi:hypothetical protein